MSDWLLDKTIKFNGRDVVSTQLTAWFNNHVINHGRIGLLLHSYMSEIEVHLRK